MSIDNPAVQGKRLRGELKSLRQAAGHTQRDVADAMSWSPSKVVRVEKGQVRITPNDLRALLAYYRVTDGERVEHLVAAERASRESSWSDYKDVHVPAWLHFLELESSASVIREFNGLLLSGLLQIEEYALDVLKAYGISAEVAEKRWEVRVRRRELFEREAPPEMFFVLDESVVRRQIAGPGVMRRQLMRVREVCDYPGVTVQILPFSLGSYRRIGASFEHLKLPGSDDEDVLHVENPQGGVTVRDETGETSEALERFLLLEEIALSPKDTCQMLDELIDSDVATASKTPKGKT